VVFYRQKDVPEIFELTWIFNCLVNMGMLERAHAYKQKVSEGSKPNVGLFAYPVLQAADILITGAQAVPVGEDQRQHIEYTREIARTFNTSFTEIFKQLFDGGKAELVLEDDDIDKGLKIRAAPPKKDPHIIQALSGGEKTMTAIAFVFAILEYEESPFYIMDEIDAALDKINSKKLSEILKDYAGENQFIVISHNDITVRHADRAYGVSMREGVSKVRSIELDEE